MQKRKEKKEKLLVNIDKKIQNCIDCNLYKNGRAKPFYSDDSKFMMILEAPGKEEVNQNNVVVGKTGKLL